MTTTVVNVRTDEFDVYVGRPVSRSKDPRCRVGSPFRNPFKAPDESSRPAAIIAFEMKIRDQLRHSAKLRAQLLSLDGKRLGCWCKPKACHGDVLVKLIEELKARAEE